MWRDAKGRFASPVYFDGKRYRDARSGKVSVFATSSQHPSKVAEVRKRHPIKAQKPPVRFAKPSKPVAKPPRKPVKAPPKPVKAKPPRKPGKPARKPPKRPPKKPPKKPVKKPAKPPEKVPIPQIFGKNRHEVLTPIKGMIRQRIIEAEALVRQVQERGHDASDLSEIGYEYYQLIASVENMSPHDVYTLFRSPGL